MRPIPDSIKFEVIRKYLEGYSITEISKQLKVSVELYLQLQKRNQEKMSIIYIYTR